jgi:serine/threonine protein kinase
MGVCNSNNEIKNQKLSKNIENDPDYILPKEYTIRKSISEDYKMDSNFIGRGASGQVYIAQNKKNEKFAIKTINKSHIKFKQSIISEVKISLSLNHPHIVKCYNVYEDLKSISFVLELIEGGDLFDFIKKYPAEHLDDDIALEILIQILEILNYLHNELRICHRDIKLENFLISIIHDKPKIKIIDFGYLVIFQKII